MIIDDPQQIENLPRYEGNELLRAAGGKIAYTAEQIEEIKRCMADPVYFIETYYQIITLDHGLVPIRPYNFQKRMIRAATQNRFVIAKIGRQFGKTTIAAAILLWHALFTPKYSIAILANKADQAQEILERIQLAYENLPLWLQKGVRVWNKRSLTLENRSKIFTAATSASGIRGRSVNLLYLDEFAHVMPNLQESFYTSTYPVITSGKDTKVIITSTPKGFEMFKSFWDQATLDQEDKPIDTRLDDGVWRPGKNGYIAIETHWSDIPGRDQKWKDMIISQTSEDQFSQEFETEFLGSSDTLISGTHLKRLRGTKPISKSNNLKIFAKPEKDHQYAIVVDTSRGVGLDYNAFVVVDCSIVPYKIVATFKDNRITPLHFPDYIYRAATEYNGAIVLVETNDNGMQIADTLHFDLECENVLMTTLGGKKGQQITSGFGANARRGIKTSPAVKRIGCTLLKSLVENNKLLITDDEVVSELTTFVATGNSYAAEPGKNDDLVMCLVLFAWLTGQRYFKDLTDKDVRKLMADEHQENLEEDVMPFGFFGHEEDDNAFD